jgi:PhnB protein
MATAPLKMYTYLNFGGNCEEAFRFYEKHLGGKFVFKMTFGEMPDKNSIPPGQENAILHARLDLGGTAVLGADIPSYQPMRSAYLTLIVGSIEEAEHIHALLSDGGEIFMPMAETFFAFRFSMLRDKLGVSWMIIHERPMPRSA